MEGRNRERLILGKEQEELIYYQAVVAISQHYNDLVESGGNLKEFNLRNN